MLGQQKKQVEEHAVKRVSDAGTTSHAGSEMPSQSMQDADETQTQYPPTRIVAPIMISLYLAMFLVSLDRTIIATAIPQITDHFKSIGDIGWYGSAYLLTGCSTQLLYGRLYTFYSIKAIFLASVAIFEAGSALCGASPNSTTFIIGRAIAGLGSAGVFAGVVVITVPIIPLEKRPFYQGFLGAVFGISSVVGPIVGGALTTRLSWRWCFYINLPVGGMVMAIIILLLKVPSPDRAGLSLKEKINQLDPLGTLAFIPSIVCLLLALQWGGSTYAWSNGRIIALIVVFGLLLLAFIAIQVWKKETASLPLRILGQRSIASGFCYQACVGAGMLVIEYYLPIWFQAIKGVSSEKSGIMILPLILALIPGTVLGGMLVSAIGYYTPLMILSAALRTVASGLMTTFRTNTGHPMWIGYQVVYGFGLGLGMMHANMAAQVVLAKDDIATGTALMFFAQSLGGAVFLSVAQNIFAHKLVHNLDGVAGLDIASILNAGATSIRNLVPAPQLQGVLEAYNAAVTSTFYAALALACVSIIPAFTMQWVSVKGRKVGPRILSEEEAKEWAEKQTEEKKAKKQAKQAKKQAKLDQKASDAAPKETTL